ncbi:MAG: hypothetical protein IJ730_05835 [Alphaproteobacteria bacterium]|nr:hypothetical protein [Alphaproteobacteria bacterium]
MTTVKKNKKKMLFVLIVFYCTTFVSNAFFPELFTKSNFSLCGFAHMAANEDKCTCPQSGLSTAASVIDYVGIGGWLYLSGRSFLKAKVSALEREYVLMSPFQKFLSSEWMSVGLTLCSAAAFLQLITDSPKMQFTASMFGGGIPAAVGLTQLGFDTFKILRKIGCLRWICCDFCQPKKYTREDKEKLLDYYRKKKKEIFLKECQAALPIIDSMIKALQQERNNLEKAGFIKRIEDLDDKLKNLEVGLYLLDGLTEHNVTRNEIELYRKNIDEMKSSSSCESAESVLKEEENDKL